MWPWVVGTQVAALMPLVTAHDTYGYRHDMAARGQHHVTEEQLWGVSILGGKLFCACNHMQPRPQPYAA